MNQKNRLENFDFLKIILDRERELQDTYTSQRQAIEYLETEMNKGVRLWEMVDKELSVRRRATMYLFRLCAAILVAWKPNVREPERKAIIENAIKAMRFVKTMLA